MKIFFSVFLLLFSFNVKSQTDTTCIMVRNTDILEFDFYTSKVTNKYIFEDSLDIYVEAHEVLCLHLYTEKRKKLKVVTVHDGHVHEDFLQSKDNVYYVDGPVHVIVFN